MPAFVEFTASGKLQQGLKLVEFAQEIVIIGRDGWLHTLKPSSDIRVVPGEYEPIPAAQLRNELRAEFGRSFEVLATKNFLVVQPVGRGDQWPNMFEQSHRAFLTFMRRRGVEVLEGRFPMVAVVLPDEQSMYAEFKKQKIDMSRVAGVYSSGSNRVITHDSGQLEYTAATVRHETAHQSAFNSGVHSRLNDTPKWITEGVGQMFEPAAMSDIRRINSVDETINHESLALLRKTYDLNDPAALAQAIESLVLDDSMFDQDAEVETAYAVAWAMMFYTAHRQPDAFAAILNHTSSRPPFVDYKRSEKMKDFERLVDANALELSKRLTRFLNAL
jgi:Protein of unknown function (DUF1570)